MTFLKSAMTSAALLTGGMFAMTPDTADAQVRFQLGIGGGGYGYNSGRYYRNPDFSYGRSYNNYGYSGSRYNSFYGRSGSSFYGGRHRDHGHYDYHPTTVVPHGNHYDVIPGHYDYHYGHHH